MMKIDDLIVIAVVTIAIFQLFAVILGSYWSLKRVRLLKAGHHDVWVELNGHSLLDRSIRGMVFILKRNYLQLEDDELTRICNKLRILVHAMILNIFVLIIVTLLMIVIDFVLPSFQ